MLKNADFEPVWGSDPPELYIIIYIYIYIPVWGTPHSYPHTVGGPMVFPASLWRRLFPFRRSGLILGVETGYSVWQSIPEPPPEAFSDTGGPFVVLFMGWFPALVLLGGVHFLLCRYRLKLLCCVVGQPPKLPNG